MVGIDLLVSQYIVYLESSGSLSITKYTF